MPTPVPTRMTVNGEDARFDGDTRRTLLDFLREDLGLKGSKKGCDHGQCGACTVIVNGRRINACLSLAVMHDGDEVTTIEGIGTGDELSPIQAAFVAEDGFQCGYCTPGQICSATAMLEELKAGWPSAVTDDVASAPDKSAEELRERMSGNLCRCGAYSNIGLPRSGGPVQVLVHDRSGRYGRGGRRSGSRWRSRPLHHLGGRRSIA